MGQPPVEYGQNPQPARYDQTQQPYGQAEPYVTAGPRDVPPRRRRGVGGAVVAAIVVILALLLLMSPWFWAFLGDIGISGRQYDEGAKITVTRTISFSVTGPWTVDYILDVPLPKSISDGGGGYVQEMTKTDPDPTPLDEYKYGQHWMVWESSDSSGRTFTIDYGFEIQTVVWDIESSESADVADIPQDVSDRYTGAEWKIDPGASGIADLADDITRNEDGVRDKLKAIYDYLAANIDYESGGSGIPKDCTATLADGTGDCDDQSILFCSLARAAGIPSWLEFGALYDRGGDVWGGHAWVKAYIPLKAGGGGAVCIDVVNREFLVRPCNRFADWECDGNGTHMEDYYNTLSYSSMHSVSLDYSETYDGDYEPTGGKVSAPGAITGAGFISTSAIQIPVQQRFRIQTDL